MVVTVKQALSAVSSALVGHSVASLITHALFVPLEATAVATQRLVLAVLGVHSDQLRDRLRNQTASPVLAVTIAQVGQRYQDAAKAVSAIQTRLHAHTAPLEHIVRPTLLYALHALLVPLVVEERTTVQTVWQVRIAQSTLVLALPVCLVHLVQ